MPLDAIKIGDTGKGMKSVSDNLEAVLRKIEHRHQGSIVGYHISYQNSQGTEHVVKWVAKKCKCSGMSTRLYNYKETQVLESENMSLAAVKKEEPLNTTDGQLSVGSVPSYCGSKIINADLGIVFPLIC